MLVTVLGGVYALRQMILGCKNQKRRADDEIDLASADSNAMFFRHHNVFEDKIKEKETNEAL